MGGVVVAKALCIAKSKKQYEAIATCTMGCLFFGVPFRGTEMARIALMYSSVFGSDAYEALLTFMKAEKNDVLDEVREDFVEFCNKLVPAIEVYCFWEQVSSDVAYSTDIAQKLGKLGQHKYFAAGARAVTNVTLRKLGAGTHVVSKESAEIDGAHSVSLAATHRDLIRFESVTSENFVRVKAPFLKMAQTATMNARKRNLSSGQTLLTRVFVNQVRQALEGVDMRSRYRAQLGERQIKSWLAAEQRYQDWVSSSMEAELRYPHVWLRGGAGFGKTNASLAAIQQISKSQSHEVQATLDRGSRGAFLGYFLCERAPGFCTAEDVLKSLITQLVNQEESLAQHGKWFVSSQRYRNATSASETSMVGDGSIASAQATTTVDNLWKCLQDMLEDPVVNSAHLVLNNIHCMEAGDSTMALLSKLREDAIVQHSPPLRTHRTKWLITSRNEKHIRDAFFGLEQIYMIDLEDKEYGSERTQARKNHVRDSVRWLKARKNWTVAWGFSVQSSLDSQGQDEQWIEVLCLLLDEKPSGTSNLSIEKWLREMGKLNVYGLIGHAWQQILTQDEEIRLKLEQLLQVMTIVYEPPTLSELAVLMAVEDLHELVALVKKCSPVLRFADTSAEKDKVVFGHTAFRERLFVEAHGHAGSMSPRIREYHGRMALLCFEYIQTRYGSSDLEEGPEEAPHRRPAMTTRATDDASVLVVTNEDDEFDDGDEGSLLTSSHACSYPIKYLIRHLGEGSPDAAQTLCEDDPDFWGFRSSLRDTWLTDFRTLTTDLKDIDTSGMSALHIAAGIGANELVSMLVDRNGATALAWTNHQGLTALHVAALNDRASVVEALIRAGADIEAGDGSAGTPLHMAALHGRVDTVGMLIARGANVNAFGHDVGPVINAAILSGSFETVKHVMSADVHFVVDYITCPPPLSLSAGRSEPSLFRDILETGKEKWLQNGKLLDQAIIAASAGGRLESIRILLNFEHAYTSSVLQTAILSAAVENKWVVTRELLSHVINDNVNGAWRDIELEDTFYLAAVSREEQLDVLGQIWHLTQHSTSQDTKDYAAYQATALRKTRTVTWLLEVCGASPNASSSRPNTIVSHNPSSVSGRDYITALNAAAGSGNLILTKSLIQRGANIDGASNYALQLAARGGYIDVVNMLLDHDAAIDRKVPDSDELDFASGTALQAACEYGRLDVVETLLRRGADPNLNGRILSRPLVVATQDAKLEILKLLLAAPGTEPNVHGGESQATPLIFAAANMSVEAVRLLLQKGADINAKDNLGDTALIMAAWKGDRDCVEHLCDQGADVTYRSPHRGLASQVAANEHHADCENVLAAKMGDTIEDYRNGAILSQARLKKRDAEIETLMARLAEAHEERDLAKRDVEFHKHEKETLVSESDFHGEAYASMEDQLRDAQNERTALSNQVRAARGQANLANGSVVKLRGLLTEQREINDALRQRTGYTALQEEKTTALALVSELRAAASKQAEAAQMERSKLEEQVNHILARCQQQNSDKERANTDMQSLMQVLEAERVKTGRQEEYINRLQQELKKSEDILISIQEAASRERTKAELAETLAPEPVAVNGHGSNGTTITRSQSDTKVLGDAEDISSLANALTRKPVGQFHDAASALRRTHTDTTVFAANAPSSSSVGGFTTIHGIHRPNGALGGYRTNRRKTRMPDDELYTTSRNGSLVEHHGGTESIHQHTPSVSGSAET
ncbi:hypothetical protein LTR86_001757 [Recurvomyces mirabilis]|nr:hypothetical protein LTR86_001757 [Recurvomyces mirabilis]